MGPRKVTSDLCEEMSCASQASLEAQWVSRAQGPGCEMLDRPEILRVFTGAPSQSLNCVTRAKFEEHEADARVRETHDYFGGKGVPMIWWVGPYSRPSDLGERLLATAPNGWSTTCPPWQWTCGCSTTAFQPLPT